MTIRDRLWPLREQVAKILDEKTPPGEEYGFDIALSARMEVTPGGVKLTASYLLIVTCRSPVLVPPMMYCPAMIDDPCPSPEQIADQVDNCLVGLDAARRRLLAMPGTSSPN